MSYKDKNYKQAKERVEKKISFLIHAGVYVVVNAGLITLNLMRSPEKFWFIWPLAGWGIGLAFHAYKAFGAGSAANWKEKMIEKEQRKLDQ
ncbi:2TM domain-containing protein [uncultured Gimesia sp.]|uniref:2TM domain-containing protein n=1 Tax=uncultured Gimesia sp. TaxID=1678688 RepID=UPI0030D76F9C|tara:strand:- start:42873 stop:43145 length:273 start_codon:yes stop_codon:yes gene_type:complete